MIWALTNNLDRVHKYLFYCANTVRARPYSLSHSNFNTNSPASQIVLELVSEDPYTRYRSLFLHFKVVCVYVVWSSNSKYAIVCDIFVLFSFSLNRAVNFTIGDFFCVENVRVLIFSKEAVWRLQSMFLIDVQFRYVFTLCWRQLLQSAIFTY